MALACLWPDQMEEVQWRMNPVRTRTGVSKRVDVEWMDMDRQTQRPPSRKERHRTSHLQQITRRSVQTAQQSRDNGEGKKGEAAARIAVVVLVGTGSCMRSGVPVCQQFPTISLSAAASVRSSTSLDLAATGAPYGCNDA